MPLLSQSVAGKKRRDSSLLKRGERVKNGLKISSVEPAGEAVQTPAVQGLRADFVGRQFRVRFSQGEPLAPYFGFSTAHPRY